jgi:Protein of unknown function (DUF3592)
MRAPLIGIGIVAVLVGAYVIHPLDGKGLFRVAYFAFLAMFAVVWIGHYLLRQRAIDDWPSTEGRIESCRAEMVDRGVQTYVCVYLFSVDDARQGGELYVYESENRLDELKAALVGQPVTVRYDPDDCTKSVVEETHINGWKLG